MRPEPVTATPPPPEAVPEIAAARRLPAVERARLAAWFAGADPRGGAERLLAASARAWRTAARYRGLAPPAGHPGDRPAALRELVAALVGVPAAQLDPAALLAALERLRPYLPAWPVSDRRYRLGAACWWEAALADAGQPPAPTPARAAPGLVRLKCLLEPGRLRFLADLDGAREQSLAAESPWPPERAAALRNRLAALNAAAPRSIWREVAADCARQVLPPPLRAALRGLPAGTALHLQLDDRLGWLPFEIFPDGRGCWGQRLRLWRDLLAGERDLPGAAEPVATVLAPAYPAPWRLPGAAAELEAVRAALAGAGYRVRVLERVDRPALEAACRESALLHFIGHAVYRADAPEQSLWRLSAGEAVTAAELGRALRAGAARLLFANACHSAPDSAGLAVAFYRCGAAAFLGTCRELPDEVGAAFAASFYRRYAVPTQSGPDAAEAARAARAETAARFPLAALAYTLYGRPEIALDAAAPPRPLLVHAGRAAG